MAHAVEGAGESEICRDRGRLETQGRVDAAVLSQRQSTGRISFLDGILLFPLKAFDWLDHVHSQEG